MGRFVRQRRGIAAWLGACLALLVVAAPAHADVTVPSLFSDGMVLQRDRPLPVWGWADPGERVSVRLGSDSAATEADAKGRWRVTLPAQSTRRGATLIVRGRNTLRFRDVLLGEVWVCTGQSNMAWPVERAQDAAEEIRTADWPKIRLFSVLHRSRAKPLDDLPGRWDACASDTVRSFSAVAYFFGREIHRELDVPVGLVHTSWSGTPAIAWAPLDALREVKRLEGRLRKWDDRIAKHAVDPEAKDPGELRDRPGNLWNGMVAPLVPFAIRGVICYQGESSVGRAAEYAALFPALVRSWRERWGQGNFPFYYVQLANFAGQRETRMQHPWAILREAQRLTLRQVPNTGMAVTIDIGNSLDIHPRNKQEVGRRLALWALAKDYGRAVSCSGPLLREADIQGPKVALRFDHTDGGLRPRGASKLAGFVIAGEDRRFRPAFARIEGGEVVVFHARVRRPAAVRYAWANDPEGNLENGAGLPASPFRTDDWPLP